jgi:serine/threonine protein phosphatase PrpC
MRVTSALRAAGETDPGLNRDVNEDRFHVDTVRGLFVVIDGIGGQAAGGKAADSALTIVRARLERETGPTADRVREAITAANNEIHRRASLRPEWKGMACVLTVAVVEDGRAVIGHVGDSRLYKLRNDRIEKITRDHSPVGEREDANELSELEAMRHPRRNEVYRDVGSEPHEVGDPDFIDLHEIQFEADAALLLCSDGLTDLVDSSSINDIVGQLAGQPHEVVRALITAANDAGGKDNVTAVYVEGEQFAPSRTRSKSPSGGPTDSKATQDDRGGDHPARAAGANQPAQRWQRLAGIGLVILLILVVAAPLVRKRVPWLRADPAVVTPSISIPGGTLVRPTESIMAALERAQPGSDVVVEPGEYRERIMLKDNVRVLSRVPRGATIRLPSTASEGDPAVVAAQVSGAELVGFRIVGDAATPLGTGLLIHGATVTVVDVEITGAATVAIDVGEGPGATLMGSDVHDNSGAALRIRSGASLRVAHNVFARNGTSERAVTSLIIDNGATADFSGNVFHGIGPTAFVTLDELARAALVRDNWFVNSQEAGPSGAGAGGSRRSR